MASDAAARVEGEFLAALAPGRTVAYLAAVHCSGNADLAARVVRDLHAAGRIVIRGGRCYLPGQVDARADDPPACTDPLPPLPPRAKEPPMSKTNEAGARVLAYLRSVPDAATRQIVHGTGLSRSVTLTALRALRVGPIECFGEGTGTRYRLRERDASEEPEPDPLEDLPREPAPRAPPTAPAPDAGDLSRSVRREWADAALPQLLAELAEHESIVHGLRARIEAAIAVRSGA